MSLSAPVTPSLMLRLREQTRPLHTAAESHPIQRAMVQGTLPQELYVAYLERLFPVHRALDAGLTQLAENDHRAGRILSPEQHQSGYLREDLQHFGRGKAETPAVSAVVELVNAIAASRVESPIALLGFHYVTLGSTNGGRFIANAVRRAYGLERAGAAYLDPWGDEQPRIWQGFKRAMDAESFSQDEADEIVGAAETMFHGITYISESLRSNAS